MKKCRLLDLKKPNSFTWAFEEVLETADSRNVLVIVDTPTSVRIGKDTDIRQIDINLCKEKNIAINRSSLGGGVILNGEAVDFALRIDEDFFSQVDDILDVLMDCLVRMCEILGVPAAKIRKRGNDILVGEKKVCGSAMQKVKWSILLGTTITRDFDYDLSKKILRINSNKFKDKKAKSVEEWVTTFKKELNRSVSYKEVRTALLQSFEEILGIEFEEVDSWNEQEKQALQSLQEKYQSEEWRKYGRFCPIKEY